MPSSWNSRPGNDALAALSGAATLAVVLGSGLAGLCRLLSIEHRIPYREIPSLPEPTVEGHPGFLALARLGGSPILLFAGRRHAYEGPEIAGVTAPVSLAAELGCTELLLTNAAGSLSPRIRPGTWMLPEDVLPFPARLAAGFAFGAGERRSVASPLVSPRLRQALRLAGEGAGVAVVGGVLAWMQGPSYETAAEARAALEAGADAATMSVYPELVAARRLGIDAAVLSWITNFTANLSRARTDHADVLGGGGEGCRLLASLLERLPAMRAGARK